MCLCSINLIHNFPQASETQLNCQKISSNGKKHVIEISNLSGGHIYEFKVSE